MAQLLSMGCFQGRRFGIRGSTPDTINVGAKGQQTPSVFITVRIDQKQYLATLSNLVASFSRYFLIF